MTPEALLGPALADAVREIVRREIEARPAAVTAPVRRLLTVPAAAKETGIAVETIRELSHAGRLTERLAGAKANPKRRTFLVYADEVLAALERPAAPAPVPVDFARQAERIRARAERKPGA